MTVTGTATGAGIANMVIRNGSVLTSGDSTIATGANNYGNATIDNSTWILTGNLFLALRRQYGGHRLPDDQQRRCRQRQPLD